jgi:hypothetical protein
MLLALLVLLMFHLPALSWGYGPPPVFVISEIYHTSDQYPYPMNLDSRVVLFHNGTIVAYNDEIRAFFYRNEMPLPAVITTMNGYNFIQTRHFGVQWMGGSGCSEDTWSPGERLVIDFSDGTIHPGDVIRVDIIQKKSGVVISRHTRTA